MKKNKMMRVASALLVAVLLTTCAISGTFAKYVSTATGSDTARVAKWAFNVEGENIAQTNTFVFDLFNYTDSNVDVNGAGDGEKVIAPGTSGSFVIDLTNNSEVVATYAIDFAQVKTASTNGNVIPIQYSLNTTDWYDSIDSIDIPAGTALGMNGGNTTVTVYWRWVFDGLDNVDTDLGQDYVNVANVTVSATVTATQVD